MNEGWVCPTCAERIEWQKRAEKAEAELARLNGRTMFMCPCGSGGMSEAAQERITYLTDLVRRLLDKLPKERTDYSGVGWCAGCGATLYCRGTKGPRDPCKEDCVLQEAFRVVEEA